MKKVYFISGLGADKRIFSYLDLSFCEPVFLNWIPPLKNETLPSYAARLREQIPDIAPVITGISFGGMLATEIAKADAAVRAILISSNKTHAELPRYFAAVKYFPLYRWVPASLSKNFVRRFAGILGGTNPAEKKLLESVIRDSDISFVRWAIDAILHWDNRDIPPNLVHIHGTADKLLPIRHVKADYTIQDGTHVMTLDKHAEVSRLLRRLIE